MDVAFIGQQLKLPPAQVRLALLYPELPNPIPFGDAYPLGPWSEDEDDPPEWRGCYFIHFVRFEGANIKGRFAVTAEHYRIVEEYDEARERRYDAEEACAAARWEKRGGDGEAREAAPEEIPPEGKLTPRQEEFCRYYAAQPVAMRAAILAGYAESNADSYGPKLLKNPIVLERIAVLRAQKGVRYVLDRDTLHDKLEAVFFDALAERNHAAAVATLRLQAALGGLSLRPSSRGAGDDDEGGSDTAKMPGKAGARAREKPGNARTKARKKPGKARKCP